MLRYKHCVPINRRVSTEKRRSRQSADSPMLQVEFGGKVPLLRHVGTHTWLYRMISDLRNRLRLEVFWISLQLLGRSFDGLNLGISRSADSTS